MSIRRIIFRVILVFLVLFLCIFLFTLINTPIIMNSYGSKLMCENTLKMIANAAKLYQDKKDGQWPPSLLELGPYYEGKYKPGPNSIPKCPGGGSLTGDTADSDYIYYQPIANEVIPVCWDSKPHRTKGVLLPDTFSSNVLYSDGHIERLSERELFRELFPLAKTNPDVLKILNYPDEKISYIRLTIFLVGIVIGLILTRCYKFVTKK
jgi:hypothetical protein